MSRVKELNKYDKLLQNILRDKKNSKKDPSRIFYYSGTKFFQAIMLGSKNIMKENKINLFDLDLPEKTRDNLMKYNRADFNESGILIDNTKLNTIVDLLSKSTDFDMNTDGEQFGSVTKNNFHKANIVEDDLIYLEELDDFNPSYILEDKDEATNYGTLLMNLWVDNDIIYKFKNTGIEKITKRDKLQTNEFMITQRLGSIDVTTCYESVCNFQSDASGGVCGRKVTWCDAHLSTNVKCTNDLPGSFEGHKINTIGKSVRHTKFRTFYAYNVYDCNDKGEERKEVLVYSIIPLTQEYIKCNCVVMYDSKNNTSHQCIIAIDDTPVENAIKEPIIVPKEDSFFFLTDMYEHTKEYLKKYHDLNVTNQNSIVAKFMIFQSLCLLRLNKRIDSIVFGTSGGGKTFFSKFLIPLYSSNYNIVYATQATRNRLIGGRGNVVINGQSTYSPGFWETNDFVFFEEASEALNEYVDANKFKDLTNNIFTLKKMASSGGDVGIQGSRRFTPHAASFFVGNLENLSWSKEYYKLVRKKYYNYTGKSLNPNLPLFKSPIWYKEELDNEELGKAHAVVRSSMIDSYMTHLPPAEQARFQLCIFLEDMNSGNNFQNLQYNEYQQDVDFVKHFHRKEYIESINKIFDFSEEEEKIWEKTAKEIFHWIIQDYLVNEENNYRLFKEDDINTHMVEGITHMSIYLIRFQKQYTRPKNLDTQEDVMEWLKFTEDDKNILRYFHRFNYNSLTKKEAAEIVKPNFNNVQLSKTAIYEHDDNKRLEYYKKKLDEETKVLEENLELNEGDIFDKATIVRKENKNETED